MARVRFASWKGSAGCRGSWWFGVVLLSCSPSPSRASPPGERSPPAPAAASARRAWGEGQLRDALQRHWPTDGRFDNGVRELSLGSGRRALLSLDPALQSHLDMRFQRYGIRHGSVVALDAHTGRVLAMVSAPGSRVGDRDGHARTAAAPAASVFKIVTAAALLDRGVRPDERLCYRGGRRSLRLEHLTDSKRDRSCATFAQALGGSLNVIFAKLADRHLDSATLERYALAFGFSQRVPFDLPVGRSRLSVPEASTDRLEFARVAAGFWHSHLSAIHGALVAATVANEGVMPAATVVDRVVDGDGRTVSRRVSSHHRRVISAATASTLSTMMEETVTHGTAREWFFDQQGRPFVPGVTLAGKTGTLARVRPHRSYTWWVGFGRRDEDVLAVAALVVNGPKWRVKGSYLAREALRVWFRKGGSVGP